MARVQVMYWKEIPAQVKAEDDGGGRASVLLDPRFQQGIDAIAMIDGSAGTDEYLDGWGWHDIGEVDGSADEAAARVTARFNDGFPKDFVARVRDLHRSGERDATPGAIDHWSGV